jgi:hypothetical protein
MPNGTKWRIVYTQFGGKEVDSTAIRNGRASQGNILNYSRLQHQRLER